MVAEQPNDASSESPVEKGRSAEISDAAGEGAQGGGDSSGEAIKQSDSEVAQQGDAERAGPANKPGEAGQGDEVAPTISEDARTAGAPVAASQETPAAWYQDPNVPNQQRYWDGSTWTDQTKVAEPGISTTKRSADERKALLAQQLQSAAARGLRVESQSEFQAVLVKGQPINHVLHAIITIFSCGLWGIIWIILAVTGGEKREMVVVDEFGNVQLQKLGKA